MRAGKSVRKFAAGALITLAHRIYPPKVTEVSVHVTDPAAARAALTSWEAETRAQRAETRWR